MVRLTDNPRPLLVVVAFVAACTASPAGSAAPSPAIASPISTRSAIQSTSPSVAPSSRASAVSSPISDFDWSLMPAAIDLGNETRFGVVAAIENQMFGRFGFAKLGVGIFWADGATVTPSGDGRINVAYQGPGWRDPDAEVDLFLGFHMYSAKRERVELDLDMELLDQDVAAEYGVGHGRLIADGVRYSVGTDGQAPPPDDTVDEVVALVRASDWRGLHGRFVSLFQTGIRGSDYESEMRKGMTLYGTIVEVEPAGLTTTYEYLGGQAARVTLEVTFDKDGVTAAYQSQMHLVYGEAGWRILDMTQLAVPGVPAP